MKCAVFGAHLSFMIRPARGRPASRRIPLPPGCLPRAACSGGHGGREAMRDRWISLWSAVSIIKREFGASVGRAQALLGQACVSGEVRSRTINSGVMSWPRVIAPQEWSGCAIDLEDDMLTRSTGNISHGSVGPVEVCRDDLRAWVREKTQSVGHSGPSSGDPSDGRSTNKGGRPAVYDWHGLKIKLQKLLQQRERPNRRHRFDQLVYGKC